jgi:hypothetical protein
VGRVLAVVFASGESAESLFPQDESVSRAPTEKAVRALAVRDERGKLLKKVLFMEVSVSDK